jgi:NhaP-type Na+/H+ or K+/H+ antiporter
MLVWWFVIVGALLILMALLAAYVERLPLNAAVIYLAIGYALGLPAAGMLQVDALADARTLELAFEVTVLISLFTVGLKLRVPFTYTLWLLPIRLATVSMLLTIALVAAAAWWLAGLRWELALLLGAVLAPTDPVLASDVQMRDPADKDRARFSLTAEGGLNDGTAFPVVMLALYLLQTHDKGGGALLLRWFAFDVVWAVACGLAVGWGLAQAVGRLVLRLRSHVAAPEGLEMFLSLGLIAFSYGVAQLLDGLGFLAVLAAGVSMRRFEVRARERGVAASDRRAPVEMVNEVVGINERIERLAELGAVLLIGGLLAAGNFSWLGLALAALLFFVARPLSVWAVLRSERTSRAQRWMVAWFGVRGVGSMYYLMYAAGHGIDAAAARQLSAIVVTVVAASIVVYGITATPLMQRYRP